MWCFLLRVEAQRWSVIGKVDVIVVSAVPLLSTCRDDWRTGQPGLMGGGCALGRSSGRKPNVNAQLCLVYLEVDCRMPPIVVAHTTGLRNISTVTCLRTPVLLYTDYQELAATAE